MSASYGDYQDAFESLIGSTDEERTYYGEYAAGVAEWVNIFEETGIYYDSTAEQMDAFENFLIAFYPSDHPVSGDDWQSIRQEFYDLYDIDAHNIDWEAYREAIGY